MKQRILCLVCILFGIVWVVSMPAERVEAAKAQSNGQITFFEGPVEKSEEAELPSSPSQVPSYKDKSAILPVTGDQTMLCAQVAGSLLLVGCIGFMMKKKTIQSSFI